METLRTELGAKIGIKQEEDDGGIYCEIDLLLFELDNVVDDNELKSIPDDLVYRCQLFLALWSTDGSEGNDHPPSTLEHHANADHLMDKLKQTHLILAVSDLDRQGFIRDIFGLEHQMIVSAVQYY